MKFTYRPKGVCSSEMIFDIEGDTIKSVEIINGCSGNTKGISKLVEGMKIDDVIKRLKGIPCGARATSCPDQLATALQKIKEENM